MPGKPLYKIADLSKIILRAYVSETQLNKLKIGQTVKVYLDIENGKQKEFKGNISWISSTPEFTPKIIQTKEERVNLVFAVKINVINDGSIKPGMPGEVNFQ
jgi:HlyD family secretion protein